MCKTNSSILKSRVGMLLLAFLLCVLVLAGCGKEDNNTKPADNSSVSPAAAAPTATPTLTPTATCTPTPTPTVAILKQAYQTFARDDLYQIPMPEFDDGWELMSGDFAGEYAMLRLYKMSGPDGEENLNSFVLMKPALSTDRFQVVADFVIRSSALLADGTVIIEEMPNEGRGNGLFRVYDNTMKLLRTFTTFEDGGCDTLGIADDGTIWSADNANAKLLSSDLTGQMIAGFDIDPSLNVTEYVGNRNGRECFLVSNKDDISQTGFLYLSVSDGEVVLRPGKDPELGKEWEASVISANAGWMQQESDSMFILHEPGYARKGIIFPKALPGEIFGAFNGKLMSCYGFRELEDGRNEREYHVYDLEKQTVSGVLKETEIPQNNMFMELGFVGNGNLMAHYMDLDYNSKLLLWAFGETEASPIEGFADFRSVEPEEQLNLVLADMKDKYGIVITPDKPAEGESLALGRILDAMDLAYTFMLAAQANSEVVKPKVGTTIEPENMRNNDGAHFTFNPHVMSTFYLKEHGEERRDIFFAYVDALRAGEDSFVCKNEGASNWCGGRLAMMFYPVGGVYADTKYVGNGRAEIIYKIPKEEFLQKAAEFEKMIETLLNDVLEDDYTDLEKALALYEFITENYVYDYDMYEHNEDPEWTQNQSAYRVLTEKTGICGEIAILYQYLGLQCGIDMDEVVGAPVRKDDDLHAWNYINIDGTGYLIDATWGLTPNRKPSLCYFLFTDELRESRDGYEIKSFDVGFNGMYGAKKVYSFDCVDESFAELWDGTYVAFDEEEKCIFYKDRRGKLRRFDCEK